MEEFDEFFIKTEVKVEEFVDIEPDNTYSLQNNSNSDDFCISPKLEEASETSEPQAVLQWDNEEDIDIEVAAPKNNNNNIAKFTKKEKKGSKSVKNIYKCDHCNIDFKSKLDLMCHITQNTIFPHEKVLQHHRDGNIMVYDPKKTSAHCYWCKKIYNRHIMPHLRAYLDDYRHRCDVCQKGFASKTTLNMHIQKTHSNLNKKFRQKTPEKIYRCNVCKKQFRANYSLNLHKRSHNGERPFDCTYCDKKFTTQGNLTRHIRTHTGEKPYQCDICKIRSANSTDIKNHMRIHTGEKFKCELCDKSFCFKNDLRVHLIRHSGVKKYQCDICQKRFFEKGDLRSHVLTHFGTKYHEHKCDKCEKSYVKKSNLKVHVTRCHTHLGIKYPKHKCDMCEKSYVKKSSLKVHVTKCHGDGKENVI